MAKQKTAKQMLKAELEAIYIKHHLAAKETYIDARIRPIYTKWARNRLKKLGFYATDVNRKTDVSGNTIK